MVAYICIQNLGQKNIGNIDFSMFPTLLTTAANRNRTGTGV